MPTNSHHFSKYNQVAPQYPSDTPRTPDLIGDSEIDRRLAPSSPVDVAINPTVSPSLTTNTQSPAQMVAHISELPNTPKVGGKFKNAGSEGFADTGAMSSLTPPHHTRALYHSIELPELDEELRFEPQEIMPSPIGSPIPALGPSPPAETANLSSPAGEPAILESPLQTNALGLYTDTPYLHDIVRRAVFDPSFSLQLLGPNVERHLWDHAAGFDVRGLSILFIDSGTTIHVEPSMRNGGVVSVGDVLRALKTTPAGSDVRNGTKAGVIIRGYY